MFFLWQYSYNPACTWRSCNMPRKTHSQIYSNMVSDCRGCRGLLVCHSDLLQIQSLAHLHPAISTSNPRFARFLSKCDVHQLGHSPLSPCQGSGATKSKTEELNIPPFHTTPLRSTRSSEQQMAVSVESLQLLLKEDHWTAEVTANLGNMNN